MKSKLRAQGVVVRAVSPKKRSVENTAKFLKRFKMKRILFIAALIVAFYTQYLHASGFESLNEGLLPQQNISVEDSEELEIFWDCMESLELTEDTRFDLGEMPASFAELSYNTLKNFLWPKPFSPIYGGLDSMKLAGLIHGKYDARISPVGSSLTANILKSISDITYLDLSLNEIGSSLNTNILQSIPDKLMNLDLSLNEIGSSPIDFISELEKRRYNDAKFEPQHADPFAESTAIMLVELFQVFAASGSLPLMISAFNHTV